ncbi:MAG: NAD(P)/FAD-dependent oxidoreductase [Hydrogenobaculum sp.]
MRVAIIGGGPMGLAAGYYALKKGYSVDIYEKDNVLGGMSASFNFDGDIIEKYYHFFCKTDLALFELLKELNIYHLLKWKNTTMGFYYKQKLQPFGDPISLLKFDGLDIISKLRYGFLAFYSTKINDWSNLDKKYAIDWIKSIIGEKAYSVLWDKLFSLKFYKYQTKISAAWIWNRIKRVGLSRDSIFKESLGYVEGGVKTIIDSLEKTLLEKGANIYLNSSVDKILIENKTLKGIKIKDTVLNYDKVISTIPINILQHLITDEKIASKYKDFTYLDVMCVVIKLRKPFSKHFWININDEDIKIPGIINYSALRKDIKSNIVYIPFYLPKDHELLEKDEAYIKELCKSYLKKINKDLKDEDFLAFSINIYKNAQGVYEPLYLYKLPPINIANNLYALDTTYYYPEDRGFSESVRIAKYVVDRYL